MNYQVHKRAQIHEVTYKKYILKIKSHMTNDSVQPWVSCYCLYRFNNIATITEH